MWESEARNQPQELVSQQRGEAKALIVVAREQDGAIPYPSHDGVEPRRSEHPPDEEIDCNHHRQAKEPANPV